jgi:peptidoglycan L-alanyl-D-glutamate endopeptidase CwlK
MGYSFGTVSKVELIGVHPDLVAVANLAISLSNQDFAVHDGLRTLVEQEKLVAKGAAKTMKSKHLAQSDGFSHAIDLVPYINGKLRWEWGPIYYIAEAVHQSATQLDVKLVWGGVWDHPFLDLEGDREGLKDAVKAYVKRRQDAGKSAFIDGPHYQLA